MSCSGQKVNCEKSQLYVSPNTSSEASGLAEEILGVQLSKDLEMYLGFLLSPNRPEKRDVEYIVKKVKRKLTNWKTKYLSKAGRVYLANATFNAIPNYYMKNIHLPMATLHELDKVVTNFIWGSNEEGRKMHLLGKEYLFKLKDIGGLGIRSNCIANKVWMAKRCWKLMDGENNLATEVLKSKYVWDREGATPFDRGSFIWGDIGKGWDLFNDNILWILGNGEKIEFWNDHWIGNYTIRSLIHGPLNRGEQSIRVKDCIVNRTWNLNCISFNLPTHILALIDHMHIHTNHRKDFPTSLLEANGRFNTKISYNICLGSKLGDNIAWVWALPTLPKIQFFIWVSWYDRISHKINLFQRTIANDPLCEICNLDKEDTLYVLRDCGVAREFWHLLNIPNNFLNLDLKDWLNHSLKSKKCVKNLPWPCLFSFTIWALWNRRNDASINKNFVPVTSVHNQVIGRAWEFWAQQDIKRGNQKQKDRSRSRAKWEPPREEWLKLKCDAAFDTSKLRAGLASVWRGPTGIWMGVIVRSSPYPLSSGQR